MKNFIRLITKRLPVTWMAWLDYHLRPALRQSWGGAFNGQTGRQNIFKELQALYAFDTIVETGTFRGTTTEFMARHSDARIHTVEVMPRFFHYARLRLQAFTQVHLYNADSIDFLRTLSSPTPDNNGTTFFYLDAHWHADLPLDEEIKLITQHWQNVVVMIDDFQVPDDSDYAYDQYGEVALTLDYIQPFIADKLTAYFPTLAGHDENGYKRGCVVLADAVAYTKMAQAKTLRLL